MKDEIFQAEANSSNYRTTSTDFHLQVICCFLQQEGKKIYLTEMITVTLRRVALVPLVRHEVRVAAGAGSWRGCLWAFLKPSSQAETTERPPDSNRQYPGLGGQRSRQILHRKNIVTGFTFLSKGFYFSVKKSIENNQGSGLGHRAKPLLR